ncbi:MAG: 1,4-alpha-glucan branching protein GlgB [Bacteroidetes bacterium]|nr:1,4-alpha-glucan branching protein GlgB [Bacteroidota bacterium]
MAYEDEHFIDTAKLVWNYSFFTDDDIKLFQKGILSTGYEKFGSHHLRVLDTEGFYFAVWAPNATYVSVIGDFNGWKKQLHPLYVRQDNSGIWEGFIPRIKKGDLYKYHIRGFNDIESEKSDPYALFAELRPGTASIAWYFEKHWNDQEWMEHRKRNNALNAPWSVYEVHLASWMRPEKNKESSFNTYAQITERLVPYVKAMGFTHVELMPVMEYPYDGSWGYQGTGYFAATSRFGPPEELMYLIETMHQHGIGVILDWVPSHFPGDAHGLYKFDGTHTYEYADMRKGYHPDWNSYIFNYSRAEVRSFLISSAHFWMNKYHADGIRVDAVNSIIRLDFSRKEGEWEKNIHGTNENLEAIAFLKDLNKILYRDFPDIQTIAEEASDWPGITKPIRKGGFGFGMKWMMGWMHDTFRYFKLPHNLRPEEQDTFTFSIMYFYDEKFMLPLSHDEVVHGKSPMIYKMPGYEAEKFSNLRLLYTYMYTHPGAKLLFMGNEFAQTTEWNDKSELDWELLQHDSHHKMQLCVKDLNHIYRNEPAMYEYQFEQRGFEWIELNKREEGVVMYKRKGKHRDDDLLVILNLSNQVFTDWKMQVKGKNHWREIFNSNNIAYWGTGENTNEQLRINPIDKKKKICEIIVDIPALSAMIFR